MKSKFSKLGFVSAGFVALFFLMAVTAPFIAGDSDKESFFPLVPFGPESVDIFEAEFLAAPTAEHLLGTDYVGRDVLSRLVHGLRISSFFSMAVVVICLMNGLILGGLMGFFAGWIDLG